MLEIEFDILRRVIIDFDNSVDLIHGIYILKIKIIRPEWLSDTLLDYYIYTDSNDVLSLCSDIEILDFLSRLINTK